MKYFFSVILLITINTLLFSQEANNEPLHEDEKDLYYLSENGSKSIGTLSILIDSIKLFKNNYDQGLMSQINYNQQRIEFKNKYLQEYKNVQKYYESLIKHIDTFPVEFQTKIKNIKTNVDNLLPDGELPNILK